MVSGRGLTLGLSLVKGSGCMGQGPESRVQGLGFRVQGPGYRIQGSGFSIQGSALRVRDLGFRVQVQGLGFRVYPVKPGGDPPCTTSTLMPGACAQTIVIARCPALKTYQQQPAAAYKGSLQGPGDEYKIFIYSQDATAGNS